MRAVGRLQSCRCVSYSTRRHVRFAYRGLLIERGWTTSEFEAPKTQKFIIDAKSKKRSLKNYLRKKMMRNANLFRWNA